MSNTDQTKAGVNPGACKGNSAAYERSPPLQRLLVHTWSERGTYLYPLAMNQMICPTVAFDPIYL